MPRFPTAILATGLMILAFLSFFTGLILDTVVRGRREVRRLHYLSLPGAGRRPKCNTNATMRRKFGRLVRLDCRFCFRDSAAPGLASSPWGARARAA